MRSLIFKSVVCLFLSVYNLSSQNANNVPNKLINSEITIALNGVTNNDKEYEIKVKNLTINEEKSLNAKSKATIKFDYNMKYELVISCKGCCTKVIEVDTNAPVDNWLIAAKVNLSTKDKKVIKAGKIHYDKRSKTFVTKNSNV